MARTAIPGRLSATRIWQTATLVERRVESPTACTLVLRVHSWAGHLAGQHVDVRLTAEDGYQAARSYSLAAPAAHDLIEITVARVDGGEVSTYLIDDFAVGDSLELRGPLGGWFVWRPEEPSPVLLVGGGSGVVPLMAMVRARSGVSRAPFRMVYSVRSPEDGFYSQELHRRAADDGLDIAYVYTRAAPNEARRPPGRLTAADLSAHGWPAEFEPTCYVCGPTGFVESASRLLLELGHDPARIRTERFGPTGP
jgi:ferredoxin-NADP reductase